jgi:hypothetical protein
MSGHLSGYLSGCQDRHQDCVERMIAMIAAFSASGSFDQLRMTSARSTGKLWDKLFCPSS